MLDYEIHGGKGGGDKPHTPVETPNNLLSVAYAKVLLAVAEGELAGRPTARDIFLDGTPLANADGSLNFGGVKWEWRSGSQDQEYIAGVPDISTEYSVGVELRDITPWTRLITKKTLDAVRLTFQWPALLEQAENGDTNGYTMKYAVDISTDGGPFQLYREYEISGKTNTAYERTHRIELPKSTNGWTIRARRVTQEATTSRIQDTINLKSYTEVVDRKQRYPNTALLYVEFDSRTFGGGNIPKISVKTKGRVIQVPSNYDPESRIYTGIWDGSFKWAWTNNPAWVFYDLVTQNRFGLGHKVDATMVDRLALYEVAQYCDVLVDDGTGSGNKKPRHTCNVYIQEQADAWQVLRDIATIFNGMTYWNGNQFVAIADKQESLDNLPIFSRSNVIGGTFDYQSTDDKSIYTSAIVSYDDPADHYNTQVEAVWEKSEILRWGGDRKVELTAIGCTDRGEAQRKARYTLLTNMFNRTVTFQTGLQGLNDAILPGKLINVLDPLIGGREYTGRIKIATGRVITLDRPLEGAAGDLLFLTKKDGTSEARTIQAVSGDVVTVTTAYSEQILPNSVWYHEAQDLKSQIFRVTKITSPSESVFEIEAVEYNDSKYGAIDNGARLESRPISVVPPGVQAAPAFVTITSSSYTEQTMAVTTMNVTWPQTLNATTYEGQWKVGNGDWVELGTTGALEFNVKGIYAGLYVARIRAVNALGVKSVWKYSAATQLDGKVGGVKPLASLTTESLLFGIRLKWEFQEGSEDTARTEIMYSQTPSFVQAIKLGDYAYPTDLHEMHGLKAGQQFWFWGRVVDRTGNISPWTPLETAAGVSGMSALNDNGQYNDYFAEMIADTALDKSLYERIELIDGPATLPGSVNNRLKPISEKVDSIAGEVDGISDRVDTVDGRVDAAVSEINAVKQTVTANKLDADTKITNTNNKIDGINTDLNNKINQTNTNLNNAVSDLQNQINNIEDALEYDPTKVYAKGDIVRQGNKLYQALGTVPINTPPPNAASWKDIGEILETTNNLVTQVSKNTADIGILDGKVTSTASRLDSMTAAWRDDDGEGELNDALRGWQTEAAIAQEQTVRANEDEALAQRLTLMTARVGDNEASIKTLEQTVATQNSAMAQRVENLEVSARENSASISNIEKVVATNDSATTERMNRMTASIGENSGRISSLQSVVVQNNQVITERVDNLTATVGKNTADITSLTKIIVDGDSALVERIDRIDTKVGENTTNITNLTTTVNENNTATNTRIDQMNVTVGKNTSDITNLTTTVADEKAATATRFQNMQTAVNGNTTAISDLTTSTTNANTATNERITSMGTKVDKNTADITTLTKTVSDNNTAMTTRVDNLTTTVGGHTSQITNLQTTVSNLEGTTATSIQQVNSRVDKEITDRDNAVKGEKTAREAAVSSEATTRANADSALGLRVDTTDANVASNKAGIQRVEQAQATLESTVASLTTNIDAIYSLGRDDNGEGELDAAMKDWTSEASFAQEVKARADANESQTTRVTELTAKFDNDIANTNASIREEQLVRANADGAIAQDITRLRADMVKGDTQLTASIDEERVVRVTQNEAMAQQINTVNTKVGENTSAISQEILSRTSADEALGQRIDTVSASLTTETGNLDAKIVSETTARVTADEAIGQRIDTIETSVGDNSASIISEREARTSADSALSTRIDQTNASVTTETGKVDAKIVTEASTRASADTALGTRIDQVSASLTTETGKLNTAITTETTARTNADTALGTRIDQVAASVVTETGKVDAKVTSEATARANADTALGQRIDTIEAGNITENQVKALIQVETTARTNADTALGTRIDTVQTTAGQNTAAIQTVSNANASLTGKVNASWQVKMEVNSQGQYVAAGIGLGIENGPAGLQSQFLVRADRFAVVNGVNGTTTAPFVVSGGQVFISEALISKAMITNAIIGATLQSAQQTNWGGPIMTMDFYAGNVICRHPTMVNTYCVMNQNGIDVVVSGVRRVRMGVW